MTRLTQADVARLRLEKQVTLFSYDRDAQAVGIVHFGIGAFHRAHQAWYTDRTMSTGDRDWMITGVSLRSAAVSEQLAPQDGLYTVTELSGESPDSQVIGAVREVLVADRDASAIVSRIAASACRIVSFTVTEKGYCRAADGSLDPDLAGPTSFYPLLAEGLAARRKAGLTGLTLLSCDNLSANGEQLKRLMWQYCDIHDPALGKWIAEHCTFPSTMVDRIVPATTAADLDTVERRLGRRDEAAVRTEPFSQWVIEDRFAAGRPSWERNGAELVCDVAPYETAKLRMLNGAHSALAYLGIAAGHVYVHEAVADPTIRPLVERLMRKEALPSIPATPGQDLSAYSDALLARFGNPELNHRLAQIAADGSQKIPQRWLETLAHHQRRGAQCPAILAALAAWMRHLRGENFAVGGAVEDPLAYKLQACARAVASHELLDALFGARGLVSPIWTATERDRDFVAATLSN